MIYPGGDPALNFTTGTVQATVQATRLYGTDRRPAFRRTSSSGPSKNVVQARRHRRIAEYMPPNIQAKHAANILARAMRPHTRPSPIRRLKMFRFTARIVSSAN